MILAWYIFDRKGDHMERDLVVLFAGYSNGFLVLRVIFKLNIGFTEILRCSKCPNSRRKACTEVQPLTKPGWSINVIIKILINLESRNRFDQRARAIINVYLTFFSFRPGIHHAGYLQNTGYHMQPLLMKDIENKVCRRYLSKYWFAWYYDLLSDSRQKLVKSVAFFDKPHPRAAQERWRKSNIRRNLS